MALTDLETQEVKARLGYSGLTLAARPYMDISPIFEMVVAQNVNAYAEDRIRNLTLPNLRQIEKDIFAARSRYKVKQVVGEVVLNTDEHKSLTALQDYWLTDLEMLVRVPRAGRPYGSASGNVLTVS